MRTTKLSGFINKSQLFHHPQNGLAYYKNKLETSTQPLSIFNEKDRIRGPLL
jgi:hypothetical protein